MTGSEFAYEGIQPGEIALKGEIHREDLGWLKEEFTAYVMQGCGEIVLNLQAVDYIDAGFLGALAFMSNLARRSGAKFRVYGASGIVRELLILARFKHLLRE